VLIPSTVIIKQPTVKQYIPRYYQH